LRRYAGFCNRLVHVSFAWALDIICPCKTIIKSIAGTKLCSSIDFGGT
jgi:hypothetical protein